MVKRACGHRRTGPLGLCVVLVGALLALPGVASAATVRADFNGDGRADLAVGAPYEEDAGSPYYEDTGAVNVLYGTASRALGERQPALAPGQRRHPRRRRVGR